MSIELMRDEVVLADGRWLRFGADEVVVGRRLSTRMQNCAIGDTLTLNVTPFKVVGVFDHEGAQGGEVWGDVDRMMTALERPIFNRVIAQVTPDTDFELLREQLESDPRTPVLFQSEPDYLATQTGMFGGMLAFLARFPHRDHGDGGDPGRP